MERCAEKNIAVVILDRPNPACGEIIEGNILDPKFSSFVGRNQIPMRHGMTMGEMGNFINNSLAKKVNLTVVPMRNWKRSHFFHETKLPWANPSPNLPTSDGSIVFAGSVLFEGTNISEGRGTTRSLEIIGHPKIDPNKFLDMIKPELKKWKIEGCVLRPIYFMPTFQKWAQKSCGGFQIHITDYKKFRPWKLGQFLCQKLYHELKDDFVWKKEPYEYEFEKLAIDLINGTDRIRHWVEQNGSYTELKIMEQEQQKEYLKQRKEALIYR
jgi:uncharacterized protein YbbC (DUF1343 family)